MRLAFLLIACGLLLVPAGCAGIAVTPVSPPPGLLYSNYRAPLDTGLESTIVGLKEGTASVESILGLITTGDASRRKAMENGDIQICYFADYEFRNILGIYAKYTTRVYGD